MPTDAVQAYIGQALTCMDDAGESADADPIGAAQVYALLAIAVALDDVADEIAAR